VTSVIWLVHALAAGGILALQLGVNARLAAAVGHPVVAALISFLVGTVILGAFALMLRLPLPALSSVRATPWWVFLGGGIMGAFFVSSVVVLAPRLGAAVTLTFAIAGQVILSMVIDHYGLLGLPETPISLSRAVGAALLLAGIALIRFG